MSSLLEDRKCELEYMKEVLNGSKDMREALYKYQTYGNGLPEGMIKDLWNARAEMIKHLSGIIYFHDKHCLGLQEWIDKEGSKDE